MRHRVICIYALLEEVGYMPSEKYAHGDEIFEHSGAIGKHLVFMISSFQTRMIDAEWNEDSSTWKVLTNRGDSLYAKFLVLATGNLTKPKLPGIPGSKNLKDICSIQAAGIISIQGLTTEMI